MTVRRDSDGKIVLDGICPVEDAELLCQLLLATPAATCDWTGCTRLHTAVTQVLFAAKPKLAGPCGDPWSERWVAPQLR
ncbi:hypothetical protein RHPLAN_20170 [Rhodoplanes sp. Z2-YC6860]|nr:hypothetical protein RHPLAN_20170 [Rhodoplanes sp. Z2-YC6860]